MPFIIGILCFFLRNDLVRRFLVIGNALALIGASIALAMSGNGSFTPPHEGINWGQLIAIGDFFLLAVFIYLGIVRKSPLIIGLAALQTAGLIWLEFFAGIHGETSPALYGDYLSTIMVLIISIVGSITTLYALPYMQEHEHHIHIPVSKQPRFFMYLTLFLGAMNGLVLSNNMMWMYFFWEVTTLCCVMLIRHNGDEEAVNNSYRALWMNLIGGVAIMGGLVLLHIQHRPMAFQELIAGGRYEGFLLLPIALLCIGGFTKAAQMPFQGWLLGAMVAPTPVSALLHSSTMVKAGVYLILRLAPAFENTFVTKMVGIIGAFTFVAAAMLAINQSNAKKVLAYSTISNLGLIVSCAGINTPLAISAAILLIIFHAISKAMLFMAVGVVEHNIESRDIERMEGLLSVMPFTVFIMVIGILSMILPPFGAVISKWVSLEATAKMPVEMFLLVMGSAFTVLFWTKWIGRLLETTPGKPTPKMEKLPFFYVLSFVFLAVTVLVLSVMAGPLAGKVVAPAVMQYYPAAGIGQAQMNLINDAGSFPVLSIFTVILLAVIIPVLYLRMKECPGSSVYMCGENIASSTGTAFRTLKDSSSEMQLSGYYFDHFFSENRHIPWMNPVAVILIIVLIGGLCF
ncbi:MAG: NADH-quinone oxidoreductase subunit L [Firmicutes bacterium]|nr:NADH-quinone oxidoreductase subunit L [Bacillota bacterium]